ncbi:MAG TPA: thiamine phosphate synthase [Longimicrobium sp.]|uniref:thiamine phosphate synthase n=1 Tax=Longimicrobium sp. TaxID=2029185 RepID=UPI002EDAB94A
MTQLARIPPLHVVTDDEVVARGDFLDRARRILGAGGAAAAFHLRAPQGAGRRMYDFASSLRSMAADAGALLIVNDRVDVALAAAADGAHAGGRGMTAADARRLLGPDRLLGVSVHSVDEARDAMRGGADFLLAGTIWDTPSHPDRRGAGIGRIREIAALGIPVIAIGGVTAARAAEARDAGAAGVAVIRGVWDAPDPAEAVNEYLKHWKE